MKSNLKRIVAVVGLVLIGIAAPAMAQRGRLADGWNERNGPQVLAAFKPVVAEADKCTVRVYCDGSETVLGTVVGADGWIATKYSELHEPISCLINGKQLPAKLVGYDQPYDLAMLKVDAKDLKVVDWSDDEKGPVVGQFVATAAPGNCPKRIGVVSVPRRAIPSTVMPKALLGVHSQRMERRARKLPWLTSTRAAAQGRPAGRAIWSCASTIRADYQLQTNDRNDPCSTTLVIRSSWLFTAATKN